jgi:hypothetical protein
MTSLARVRGLGYEVENQRNAKGVDDGIWALFLFGVAR